MDGESVHNFIMKNYDAIKDLKFECVEITTISEPLDRYINDQNSLSFNVSFPYNTTFEHNIKNQNGKIEGFTNNGRYKLEISHSQERSCTVKITGNVVNIDCNPDSTQRSPVSVSINDYEGFNTFQMYGNITIEFLDKKCLFTSKNMKFNIEMSSIEFPNVIFLDHDGYITTITIKNELFFIKGYDQNIQSSIESHVFIKEKHMKKFNEIIKNLAQNQMNIEEFFGTIIDPFVIYTDTLRYFIYLCEWYTYQIRVGDEYILKNYSVFFSKIKSIEIVEILEKLCCLYNAWVYNEYLCMGLEIPIPVQSWDNEENLKKSLLTFFLNNDHRSLPKEILESTDYYIY